MKKRINYLLSTVRKFGFIMATIMIFPYATAMPAVMASEGETTSSPDEISIEELEVMYQQSIEELLYDIDVYDEVNQYVVRENDGTLSLEIPFNADISITTSKLFEIKADINAVNLMILDGKAFTDKDNQVYITDLDEDFQIQNAVNKFYIQYFKINMLLGEVEGFVVGAILFTLSFKSTALLSSGSSSIIQMFCEKTGASLFGIQSTLFTNNLLGILDASAATFLYSLVVLVMAGQAISQILASAAPGIGNIIAVVLNALLAIGAYYVFKQVGSPLVLKSITAIFSSSETGTKMKSSLILTNVEWSYQYN